MGIKLTPIIPRSELTFDSLKHKKIAIDASNMLYQFLSSIRQRDGTPLKDSKGNVTSHLVGTFYRITNLIGKGIKIAVCLDGKPPILKIKTIEEREYRKQFAEEKLKKAEKEGEEEAMYKYSKQTSRLTRPMIEEAKELISSLGIPVIQSPSEAEAQISFICEQGDVDYAASSDYDCLLYNCPRLITNLTLSQRRKLPSGSYVMINPEVIILKDVLKQLNITQDQLMIIGILCGTDYNDGVKGIGPKTALKLVHQYKKYDDIFKEVKADFDWKQIYATFKSMPIMKNYKLKWKEPDKKGVKEILVKRHEFSEERVDKRLKELEKTKEDRKQAGLSKWTK